MANVRYDRGTIFDGTKGPNGGRRFWGVVSHLGPLEYFDGEGKHIEHVIYEELFNTDSVNTAFGNPFSFLHPPYVDSDDPKDSLLIKPGVVPPKRGALIGWLGSQVSYNRDRSKLIYDVFVDGAHQNVIQAIESGLTGISSGYTAALDSKGIQRNRQYWHQSLVPNPRAKNAGLLTKGDSAEDLDEFQKVLIDLETLPGSLVEPVKWDSDDGVFTLEELPAKPVVIDLGRLTMAKLKIDGKEYEVDDKVAEAFTGVTKQLVDSKDAFEAQNVEYKKLKAKADSSDTLEEKLTTLHDKMEKSEAKVEALQKALTDAQENKQDIGEMMLLINQATEFCKAGDPKFDEKQLYNLSKTDIQKTALITSKQWAKEDLEDRSDVQIDAFFEVAVKNGIPRFKGHKQLADDLDNLISQDADLESPLKVAQDEQMKTGEAQTDWLTKLQEGK